MAKGDEGRFSAAAREREFRQALADFDIALRAAERDARHSRPEVQLPGARARIQLVRAEAAKVYRRIRAFDKAAADWWLARAQASGVTPAENPYSEERERALIDALEGLQPVSRAYRTCFPSEAHAPRGFVAAEQIRRARQKYPTLREKWAALARAGLTPQPADWRPVEAAGEAAEVEPLQYLQSWRDILDVLGLQNNPTDRGRAAKLNREYDGPIIVLKRGAQPKVERSKLLAWWNGLEARFAEQQDRARDRRETVKDTHPYGAAETVVPEIGGHVKRKRRPSKNVRKPPAT